MSTDLPDALYTIRDAHERARGTEGAANYVLEFTHFDQPVALFESSTPLPIPAEGSRIQLYGHDCRAARVTTSYEHAPQEPPSVCVTVHITPMTAAGTGIALELSDTGEEVWIEGPAVPRIGEQILWTDDATDDVGPYERMREYRVTMVDWTTGADSVKEGRRPFILVRCQFIQDISGVRAPEPAEEA